MYTHIFGNYVFNTTPISPPGTNVVVHYKSYQHLTRDLDGEAGWYVGPSMKHYWYVKCYFPQANQVCDCNTFTSIPRQFPFPEVELEYFFKQSANDIITLLSAPPATTAIFLESGDKTINALLKIAYTIKILYPLPSQATPSETVSLTMVK